MIRNFSAALAAILVLGSASVALADGYTDLTADAIRSYGPAVQQTAPLTTKDVSLPQAKVQGGDWMDRASQNSGF
jgi:hypothetical protein